MAHAADSPCCVITNHNCSLSKTDHTSSQTCLQLLERQDTLPKKVRKCFKLVSEVDKLGQSWASLGQCIPPPPGWAHQMHHMHHMERITWMHHIMHCCHMDITADHTAASIWLLHTNIGCKPAHAQYRMPPFPIIVTLFCPEKWNRKRNGLYQCIH